LTYFFHFSAAKFRLRFRIQTFVQVPKIVGRQAPLRKPNPKDLQGQTQCRKLLRSLTGR